MILSCALAAQAAQFVLGSVSMVGRGRVTFAEHSLREFEWLFTYVAVITAAVSCAIFRGMDSQHQKQVLSRKEKDSYLLGVTSLLHGIIPGDSLVWVQYKLLLVHWVANICRIKGVIQHIISGACLFVYIVQNLFFIS